MKLTNKVAHVICLNDSVRHVYIGNYSDAETLKLKLKKKYEKENPHYPNHISFWHVRTVELIQEPSIGESK